MLFATFFYQLKKKPYLCIRFYGIKIAAKDGYGPLAQLVRAADS